jgi:hypothetical protein
MKDGPVSFSELKKRVGIESSGHLTFHLDKLDGLVAVTSAGTYALTDLGKEGLALTSRIVPAPPEPKKNRVSIDRRVLSILLISLFVFAVLAAPTVSNTINQAYPRRWIAAYFCFNLEVDKTTGAWTNESIWYNLQNHNVLKSLNHVTIDMNGTILFDQEMLLGSNWGNFGVNPRPLVNNSFQPEVAYNVTMTLGFTDGSHYTISQVLPIPPNFGLGGELDTGFFFDVN